jgi:hypothetical protein
MWSTPIAARQISISVPEGESGDGQVVLLSGEPGILGKKLFGGSFHVLEYT